MNLRGTFPPLLGFGLCLHGCFEDAGTAVGSDADGSSTTAGGTTTAGTTTGAGTSVGTTTAATGSTTDATSTTDAGSTSDGSDSTGPGGSSGSTGDPLPLECEDTIVAPGELCFEDATLVIASDAAKAPAFGDVDEDDAVDLVYLIGDQIQIHLGNGDGTFAVALGDQTVFGSDIALGHIDAGSDLDLVLADTEGSELELYLGGTGATFETVSANLGTPQPAVVVAVWDIDGDNDDDAVIGGRGDSSGSLNYFESNGSTLAPAGGASVQPVYGIAFGEFSGDDDIDIAYSVDGTGGEGIFVRIGDGTVALPVTALDAGFEGIDPRGVGVGDFDDDGDDDIAYASHGTDQVGLLIGSGAGGFADPVLYTAGSGPHAVFVRDVNSDGIPDVLVGHDGQNTLMIFPGDGAGGLEAPISIGVGTPIEDIDVADVNEDTVPDIVVSGGGQETITILLSTP